MSELFSASLNQADMVELAVHLSRVLKPGDCLALHGELGAGKSTFVRAVIQALTGADEIPSPTFTLVQTYEEPGTTLWHFDAYRLKQPEDVYELGWEEALSGIVFVEWAERIAALLPKASLAIHFEYAHNSRAELKQRQITFKGDPIWALRLSPVLPPHPKI